MFKKKNLLILLFSLFFTFSGVSQCFAITEDKQINNNNNTNTTYLESFKLEDLENHKDIQQYLNSNNCNNLIENFVSEKQSTKKQSLESNNNSLNDENAIEEISKKYGIPMANSNKEKSETYVLVKRNKDASANKGLSPNVWLLKYAAENEGFYITILNIGLDTIDSIVGKIDLLGLKSRTWSKIDDDSFARNNVGGGRVYTYSVNRKQVAEKFEYYITLTEDGNTYVYSNAGTDDKDKIYERYSFSVDLYNIMDANGGERHHFVAADSLRKAGFNSNNAPALRMIASDHQYTANWGRGDSVAFRAEELKLLNAKKYEELLQMEVDSFKTSPDSEGRFSNLAEKYNQNNEIIYLVMACEKYFGIRN